MEADPKSLCYDNDCIVSLPALRSVCNYDSTKIYGTHNKSQNCSYNENFSVSLLASYAGESSSLAEDKNIVGALKVLVGYH